MLNIISICTCTYAHTHTYMYTHIHTRIFIDILGNITPRFISIVSRQIVEC